MSTSSWMGTVLQADSVQVNTGTGTVRLANILMAVAAAGPFPVASAVNNAGATARTSAEVVMGGLPEL